jgi:beta-lactamase superfamily II metal-dependent hydrolase
MSLDAPKAEDVLSHDALDGIDNPLEVLAHVSLKERSAPATAEAVLDHDAFAFAMNEETRRIKEADAYYASGKNPQTGSTQAVSSKEADSSTHVQACTKL